MLLLIGTAIGAGIIALPLLSAMAGVVWAVVILVAAWALMTYTALLVLQVTLTLPLKKNNFHSMAAATLGLPGQIVAWASMLLLMYTLTGAYISGEASILSVVFQHVFSVHVPYIVNAACFTLVFGIIIYLGMGAVDVCNRFLLGLKGCALLLLLVLFLPKINIYHLLKNPLLNHTSKSMYALIPLFLTGFGFHTVIPSIVNYLGPKARRIRWVIIFGATIPLVLYILWVVATLGLLEKSVASAASILKISHASAGVFFHQIEQMMQSKWVVLFFNGFTNLAFTTAFLGVSLGLFDFIADGFKRNDTSTGRAQTALLTLVPPFLFALLYPQGFMVGLKLAVIFLIILEVILPAGMVFVQRKNMVQSQHYTALTSAPLLFFIMALGVALIAFELSTFYLHGFNY